MTEVSSIIVTALQFLELFQKIIINFLIIIKFFIIAMIEGIRDGKFPDDANDKVKCYPKCIGVITKVVRE